MSHVRISNITWRRWGKISHPWLGASHQAACNEKELSQPQKTMFDAPNTAEPLNVCAFLCLHVLSIFTPAIGVGKRPRECVCNAHPCWNDQGVVHKCPGDRKEDSWAVSDLGDGENLDFLFGESPSCVIFNKASKSNLVHTHCWSCSLILVQTCVMPW